MGRLRPATAHFRPFSSTFEKVEATGDYGIRITLKEPSPYFFGTITYINPRIMAAHIAEQAGNPTGEALVEAYNSVDKAIGTGPFKLKSYDKTAQLSSWCATTTTGGAGRTWTA